MTRTAALLTLSIALSVGLVLVVLLGVWQLPALIDAIVVSFLWPITLLSRWRDRESRRAATAAEPLND